MPRNLQNDVEWLLDQVVEGEWRREDTPDFRCLRTEGLLPDADVIFPYQWMLCTKEVPGARTALREAVAEMRQALEGLEALLDTIDAAEAEAQAAGHPAWAPLIAILKAPFELEKPEVCDPTDRYCISLTLRDTIYGGDWETFIAWTETRGGPEQRREDLPFVRSLQAFEARYEVNLSDLYLSDTDRKEIEVIRQQYGFDSGPGSWGRERRRSRRSSRKRKRSGKPQRRKRKK